MAASGVSLAIARLQPIGRPVMAITCSPAAFNCASACKASGVIAPAVVSVYDSTCQRIECGRNANGCTSVRYTDGNAAVPQTPALIFVPQRDRTKGSGL